MALAIGGNQVSKAYLGATEIQKMYLGADLVFDNSIQPSELTPIMTNFRVEGANKDRVYFDTPLGPVTGLTTQGFIVSGKTISAVDIVNNYFTVSSDFNAWDNNTIRLESGDGTVIDFTMEPIANNIVIPDSVGNTYYVDGNATGANNGTNEADAWTNLQTGLNAASSQGDILYVKAGFTYDGGGVKFTTSGNGTTDNPIRVIGYQSTINDIATNYYKSLIDQTQVAPALDNSEMPLITSGDINQVGLQISSNYYIVSNMQSYDSRFGFVVDAGGTNVILDNCNAKDCSVAGNFILYGNTTGVNYNATNSRILNCVSVNGATPSIANYGGYNLLKDNLVYSDITGGSAIDYHINCFGNNNILLDNECSTLTGGTAGVSGHGIAFKAENFELTEYNLAKGNQVLTGTDRMFEMRNMGCQYNVCKDSYFEGITTNGTVTGGGLTIQTGAKFNIYERCHVSGTRYGIRMDGGTESGTDPLNNITEGNEFRNCIFENITTSAIYSSVSLDRQHEFNNNILRHCIFDNTSSMMNGTAPDFTYISYSGNEIIGSIINGVTNENRNSDKPQLEEAFALDKCNFFGGFSQPAYATNSLSIDPQFTGFYQVGNELLVCAYDIKVPYDYNLKERNNETTTMGSVILLSEEVGETPPVETADYYVSDTDGLDTNNGTSIETPFKTLTRLQTESANFVPGNVIAFKAGDVWEDQTYTPTHASGTLGSEIRYTSYGTGEKPIISTIGVRSLTWTDTGGNIWTSPYATYINRMWQNGTELLIGQEVADVGVDGQSFFVDTTADIFYLYSLTDPNNDTLQWSVNANTFNIRSNYIILDGLDIQGGNAEQIKLRDAQSNWTIKNSNLGYGSSYGMVLSGCSNIVVEDNNMDADYDVDVTQIVGGSGIDNRGNNDGIAIWDGGITDNVIIRRNVFTNWMHSGCHAASNTLGDDITNVQIYENEFTAPLIQYSRSIDYSGYATGFKVYNNYMHDYYGSNQLGGSNNHFYNNIIKDVHDSPMKDGEVGGNGFIITTYGPGTVGNIIENNLIWNTEGRGIYIFGINYGTGEIKDNIVRNNIVIDGGSLADDIGISYAIDQAGQSIYDNLFQNNSVYNTGTLNTVSINGAANVDITTFNAFNTDIAENINGDPLVNVDFTIDNASPCVNAGTTALSTTDYFGNTRPYLTTAVDIGINETNVVEGGNPELISNGTFDDATDWNLSGGWAIANNKATHTPAVAGNLRQDKANLLGSLVQGSTYTFSFDLVVRSGGVTYYPFGISDGGVNNKYLTVSNSYSFDVVCPDMTAEQWAVDFYTSGAFDGDISNVSLRLK